MLPTVAAALVLSAATAAPAVPLKRATGPMVEITVGQETYAHEKGIAPDDAGAVVAYLKREVGESKPQLVRVPGRAGTFLASDFTGGTGEDYGRCLFLLQSARGQIRELARTRRAGDAYSLKPVAFVGGGRTIVLAEAATEYSRGVWVFEVAGGTIRELGLIDAAVPGELGGEDPTPFAKVSLEGGRVVVRFEKDLVLGTGQEGAPVARKPVVFRQADGEFVHVSGTAKAKKAR
jgi:hypothetical protein